MNRIVREHYPVEKLPEDLRRGLPHAAQVRITVEVEQNRQPGHSIADLRAEMDRIRKSLPHDPMDSVERVRRLRDEWDD